MARLSRRALAWAVLHGLVLFGLLNLGAPRKGWEEKEARLRADPLGEVRRDPWGALRAFYHKDSDEVRYFALTNLMLGEPADLRTLRAARAGRPDDPAAFPVAGGSPRALAPYRDFPFEYPPLALVPILLPRLVTSTLEGYQLAFSIQMGLAAVAALGLAVRLARRLGAGGEALPTALARATAAVFALGLVLVTRFDAVASLLCVTALVWHVGGRPRLGALALGLAVATKVFPAVLALVLYAPWVLQRRWRDLAAAGAVLAGTLAATMVPFWALGGDGFLESFAYHGARGLQIETLYANVIVLLHHAVGVEARMGYGFGSNNLEGAAADLAVPVSLAVLAAALAGIAWHYLATRRRAGSEASHLVHHALATVLAFAALGKVLSPQFLVWGYPLALVVQGRRARAAAWLYVLACLLTQVVYPRLYARVEALALDVNLVLLARTGLLVAVAVLAMRAALPAGRRGAGGARRSFGAGSLPAPP